MREGASLVGLTPASAITFRTSIAEGAGHVNLTPVAVGVAGFPAWDEDRWFVS
jgi:hypothetical protein